jgi:hypothetical protein
MATEPAHRSALLKPQGLFYRTLSDDEHAEACRVWTNGGEPVSIIQTAARSVGTSLEQMLFGAAGIGGDLFEIAFETPGALVDATSILYYKLISLPAVESTLAVIGAAKLPWMYSPEAFKVVKKTILEQCVNRTYIVVTLEQKDGQPGQLVSTHIERRTLPLDAWKLKHLASAFSLDSVRRVVEDSSSYSSCTMDIIMHNICWTSYTRGIEAVDRYAKACDVVRTYSDNTLNDIVHPAIGSDGVVKLANFYMTLKKAAVVQGEWIYQLPILGDPIMGLDLFASGINESLLSIAYQCRIIHNDMCSWNLAMDSALSAASSGSMDYTAIVLKELGEIVSARDPLDLFPINHRSALESAAAKKGYKGINKLRQEALLDYYCEM